MTGPLCQKRIGCKSLFLKSPPPLVLASTSIYRRGLLERLGLRFDCAAPGVVETRRAGEAPAALAVRLAREKADAVAALHPGAWVIGSDQVAVLEGLPGDGILGKPGTAARCVDHLLRSSGRSVLFLTAVAVVRHAAAEAIEFSDTTRVGFRILNRASVERYVAREAPLDCAGGFKSEGLGITLCTSIDSSDPTALIGLPLIGLGHALRRAGYELP